MVRENGTFSLMDKKSSFMKTDIQYLYKHASNILIIGSPNANPKNMGFSNALESQFVFNPIMNRAIQVIVLPVGDATHTYNRIRAKNKDVVLVINND